MPEKIPYVIFVTAGARMQITIPRDCEHFIDLTPKPSDQSSLMQGIFGRGQGYRPRTVFWGTEDACDKLRQVIEKGQAVGLKPHARVRLGTGTRGRRAASLEVRASRYPELESFVPYKTFCKEATRIAREQAKNGCFHSLQRDPDNSAAYWPLIHKLIDAIEQNALVVRCRTVSLLRLERNESLRDEKLRQANEEGRYFPEVAQYRSKTPAGKKFLAYNGGISRRDVIRSDYNHAHSRRTSTDGTGVRDLTFEPVLLYSYTDDYDRPKIEGITLTALRPLGLLSASAPWQCTNNSFWGYIDNLRQESEG